jgi:CBS domain containing-hemolysin-like protein
VDGMLHIEEFNDYFGLEIESDDYDTIGGWMYAQVEIPPKKNQRVQFEDFEMIIDEVDHMRVSRLIVRKLEAETQDSGAISSVS